MVVVVESGAASGAGSGAAPSRPTAWDQPGTTRAYAAYRRGALRWFAGGVGSLALAVGLSAYALLVLRRPGLGALIVAAAIVGMVALASGGGGLLRALRFRAALQRAPWQSAELRVVGSHLRFLIDVDDPQAERPGELRAVDARLMSTSRWRVREVVGHHDGEVLLCPADGFYVLTAEGANNLYGLRPLARQGSRKRP